jgi:hypothetical protein
MSQQPTGSEHDAAQPGDQPDDQADDQGGRPGHVVIVGPDGRPVAAVPAAALQQTDEAEEQSEADLTSLVEQPAKVMRIGSMIRQLLEEVKSAPLDDASRQRLKEIETGLAPELVDELERLTLPFTGDQTPSDAELRISQAQLVGWLEGLFHGIQTAIYAQQMAARAQFEQIRRALPPGVQIATGPPGADGTGQQEESEKGPGTGGMYL